MKQFHRPHPVPGSKPHDKFFRRVVRHLECATALCRLFLSGLLGFLHLERLSFASPELISPKLKESRIDTLLLIPTVDARTLIVIVEHKSYDDRNALDQLGEYMQTIYKDIDGDSDLAMAALVSNAKHGWKRGSFYEQRHDGDPGSSLNDAAGIRFKAQVVDLMDESVQCRLGENPALAVLQLMSDIWQLSDEKVAACFRSLAQLPAVLRKELVPAAFQYIYLCHPQVYKIEHLEKIWMQVTSIDEDEIDMFEEYQKEWEQKGRQEGRQQGHHEGLQQGRQQGHQEGHQQGRQQGRQEGLQEGRQEERQGFVLRMLQDGADQDLISKYTGLNKKQIQRLANGSG